MNLNKDNFLPVTEDTKLPIAIEKETLLAIKRTIGTLKAETGGFLTCKKDKSVVDGFDFDEEAHTTSATYTHTVDWASDICSRNRQHGYITAGIIHSHPAGYTMPSFADMANCLQFIRFFKRDWLYMPIMMPEPDGNFTLYFYEAVAKAGTVCLQLVYILKAQGSDFFYNDSAKYVKIYNMHDLDSFYSADQGYYRPVQKATTPKVQAPNTQHEAEPAVANVDPEHKEIIKASPDLLQEVSVNAAHEAVEKPVINPHADSPEIPTDNTMYGTQDNFSHDKPGNPQESERIRLFKRVQSLYPEHVTNKVIVCVGVGGARHLYEDFARNGFNNFILIDGDMVEPQNVATQGIFLTDIGNYKATAAKNSIININPFAKVVCINRFLDDELSDEEFLQYLKMFPDKKPSDYLIYGCCDSFAGNKRAANLALNLGIPYIGAGIYEGGALGEIIFTYPGVTPSCPRCMTEFRYAAAESTEGITPAGSAGSVNFVTTRINATLGFIGLMLLMYHEAPGSIYDSMLEDVKDRNFVWIRMNPFVSQSALGIDFFDKKLNNSTAGSYVFMDETLWIPQHPNHPRYNERCCPLCGGEGDLRRLIHKWHDTRLA